MIFLDRQRFLPVIFAQTTHKEDGYVYSSNL